MLEQQLQVFAFYNELEKIAIDVKSKYTSGFLPEEIENLITKNIKQQPVFLKRLGKGMEGVADLIYDSNKQEVIVRKTYKGNIPLERIIAKEKYFKTYSGREISKGIFLARFYGADSSNKRIHFVEFIQGKRPDYVDFIDFPKRKSMFLSGKQIYPGDFKTRNFLINREGKQILFDFFPVTPKESKGIKAAFSAAKKVKKEKQLFTALDLAFAKRNMIRGREVIRGYMPIKWKIPSKYKASLLGLIALAGGAGTVISLKKEEG